MCFFNYISKNKYILLNFNLLVPFLNLLNFFKMPSSLLYETMCRTQESLPLMQQPIIAPRMEMMTGMVCQAVINGLIQYHFMAQSNRGYCVINAPQIAESELNSNKSVIKN